MEPNKNASSMIVQLDRIRATVASIGLVDFSYK